MIDFLTILFGVQYGAFWTAVSFFVGSVGLLCIAIFLRELLDAGVRAWRLTIGSWWADRHARQMRKRMAAVERDMAAERLRLRLLAQEREREALSEDLRSSLRVLSMRPGDRR